MHASLKTYKQFFTTFFIILSYLILTISVVKSQDTLKYFHKKHIWQESRGDDFNLVNKSFRVSPDFYIDYLYASDKATKNIIKTDKKHGAFAAISIKNLTLKSDKNIKTDIYLPNLSHFDIRWFTLDSIHFNYGDFRIHDFDYMYFDIKQSEFDHLTLSNLKARSYALTSILYTKTNQLSIDNSNFNSVVSIIKLSSFKDSCRLSFSTDTMKWIALATTEVKNLYVDFSKCRIKIADIERRNLAFPFNTTPNRKLIVNYKDCWINGGIFTDGCSYQAKAKFDNVEFTDSAFMKKIGYDTVIFSNCSLTGKAMALSLDTGNKPLYLSFYRTDVNKFDFNFSERMHLFFENDVDPDQISNTFENLLAKFKSEGKTESYKYVDIQYTMYKNNSYGIWGNIFTVVEKYWWYYGYKKWLIVFWSLGILMAFFIINCIWWAQMKNVYPIVALDHKKYLKTHNLLQLRVNQGISIFVYTAFIFFSLRVDFSKISYERSRLLILFFLQYISGLICMFFIANALLKFN